MATGSGHATSGDATVEGALDQWQKKLIDLSARNRLLNFRPRETSAILLTAGDGLTAAEALMNGVAVGLVPRQRQDDDTSRFEYGANARRTPVDRTGSSLAGAMRLLQRRSQEAFTERGINVLYLAVGLLRRTDPDGREWRAPLVMVPAALESRGAGRAPALTLGEEDLSANPALALQLSGLGVELPDPTAEDLDLRSHLLAVRRAVSGLPGATVEESVHLSYFSFSKEIMYRDLRDNAGRVARHPVVRGLAGAYWGDDSSPFDFEVLPENLLDERYPPERDPSPLITDASQRQAVLSALAGRSFVLDGPPGTGKSQTITNIIASLISDGQTVLFVSEKAAALDVVRSRLEEAGLGRFAFDLHSSKVSRRDVATELDDTLEHRAGLFGSTLGNGDLERSADLRRRLNEYAEAVTRVRAPLQMSVIDAVGRLERVPATDLAPPADRPRARSLARVDFDDLLRAARQASGAWDASSPAATPWWGVTTHRSLAPEIQRLHRAGERVDLELAALAPLLDQLPLGDVTEAYTAVDLAEQFDARPAGLPEDWLTRRELSAVERTADSATALVEECRRAHDTLRSSVGVDPDRIPGRADVDALGLHVAPDTRLQTLRAARRALRSLTEEMEGFTRLRAAVARLSDETGQASPTTPDEVDRLLDACRLAGRRPSLPEPWARGDVTAGEARRAHDDLLEAATTLASVEAAFRTHFADAALDIDADALGHRFDAVHRGLRKLGKAYRTDRDLLVGLARHEETRPRTLIAQLPTVTEYQLALRRFEDEVRRTRPVLDRFVEGRATHFDIASEAIANLRLLEEQGGWLRRREFAPLVSEGNAQAVERARDAAHDCRALLAEHRRRFESTKHPVFGRLPVSSTFSSIHEELERVIEEARYHVGALETYEGMFGDRISIDRLAELASARDALTALRETFRAREPEFSETLGDLFAADETDSETVRRALAWAGSFRERTGALGVVLDVSSRAALAAIGAAHTARSALDEWASARDALVESFDVEEHLRVRARLQTISDTQDFVRSLEADESGRHDYLEFITARREITKRGYAPLLDFCLTHEVPSTQVPSTFERAILRDFVDAAIEVDPVLDQGRSRGQDTLVEEFVELDSAVVAHGRDIAIRRCNDALPDGRIGNAQIIKYEARKQRRHIPVRDLLERARGVVQRLKPCFMMSPLAVSQFLPSRFTFDVVIFDEASQVTPWDAVNCIYRGDAFVAAGDPKQLPPTSFFAETSEPEAVDDGLSAAVDFESILDLAASSGSFRTLNLNWHYRSRHESLIAFSNATFYDDRLTTFPGAVAEDDHVGLELFRVNGVYRRGHERDNPVEADFVADRVVQHVLERPWMTLGVITLSESHARAVADAVDRAREDHPEIDHFFVEDRLQGFFVKSLENVQGDERDVVVLSVGYGPDAEGKVSNNFGPLSRNGGERRLNVAATRARSRLEVVTSMSAADIKSTSSSEGAVQLRRYLEYAERGGAVRAHDEARQGVGDDLVTAVAGYIRDLGYAVTEHVGMGSYRIDVGVHHPDLPGAYVLGVECDGESYAAAATARDRNHLRRMILERLGWRLHRVWSTSWHHDRESELRRLRQAIERALASPPEERLLERPVLATTAVPTPRVRSVEPVRRDWITTYPSNTNYQLLDLEDGVPTIKSFVERVVQNEGPIHQRVIEARIRWSAGIGRIGSRIRHDVDEAFRRAPIVRRGEFLDIPGKQLAKIRLPSDRKFDEFAPEELRAAVVGMVAEAAEISQDDLFKEIIALTSTRGTASVYRTLGTLTDQLVDEGTVERHLGYLSPSAPRSGSR